MSFEKREARNFENKIRFKSRRGVWITYVGIQRVEKLKRRAGDLNPTSRDFYLTNKMGLLENVGVQHDEILERSARF
jgi:hypothetical protein